MVMGPALNEGEELILIRADKGNYGVRLRSSQEFFEWIADNSQRVVDHVQYFRKPRAKQVPETVILGRFLRYDAEMRVIAAHITDAVVDDPAAQLAQEIKAYEATLPTEDSSQ